MDKKQYEEVKIEIITFTSKDVITLSDPTNNTDPFTPGAGGGNGN